MNATLPLPLGPADEPTPPETPAAPVRLREIPYNYTSLAGREIVIRLLGESGN